MALELRSQLCTFENSTNCNEISFDLHSFSEQLKGLLSRTCNMHRAGHGNTHDHVIEWSQEISQNPFNASFSIFSCIKMKVNYKIKQITSRRLYLMQNFSDTYTTKRSHRLFLSNFPKLNGQEFVRIHIFMMSH